MKKTNKVAMAKSSPKSTVKTKRVKGIEKDFEIWRALLLVALLTVAIAVLLDSAYSSRQQTPLEVGKPSPKLYKSPTDIEVIDQIATERKKQAARVQIKPIYTANLQLQNQVFNSVSAWQLEDAVKNTVLEVYEKPGGIFASDLPDLINQASQYSETPVKAKNILERDLLVTAEFDIKATEDAREAASEATAPAMIQLQAGQIIVREGSLLTTTHLDTLQAVGLYTPRQQNLTSTALRRLGSFLAALLLSLGFVYSYPYLRKRFSYQKIAFLVVLLLLSIFVQRFVLIFQEGLILTPFIPLLLAVVASQLLAVATGVWLSLTVALFTPEAAFTVLLSSLSATTVASLTARLFRGRTSLFLAAGLAGVTSFLAFFVYSLLVGFENNTMTLGGWMLVGSVLAGFLALGTLPFLENTVGFLTEFRLLELMNPSHPLLQRLLSEAPGTYQHSLVISNLVDQAVSNIGGNVLLARVAALYHDVGKLKRPHFFTENQFGGNNPHSSLSPHLSYLIITSHVRDGIEMLREYKLPKEFDPFVLEHHGTTVLNYFYKRALEDNAELEELNFRYTGPRPHSRETAVLMLADAVESASRSLNEPSQSKLRALIDRLIEQRLQDDQLVESNLNFRDLDVIASTFERVMMAALHRRVSYPSEEEIRKLRSAPAKSAVTNT